MLRWIHQAIPGAGGGGDDTGRCVSLMILMRSEINFASGPVTATTVHGRGPFETACSSLAVWAYNDSAFMKEQVSSFQFNLTVTARFPSFAHDLKMS